MAYLFVCELHLVRSLLVYLHLFAVVARKIPYSGTKSFRGAQNTSPALDAALLQTHSDVERTVLLDRLQSNLMPTGMEAHARAPSLYVVNTSKYQGAVPRLAESQAQRFDIHIDLGQQGGFGSAFPALLGSKQVVLKFFDNGNGGFYKRSDVTKPKQGCTDHNQKLGWCQLLKASEECRIAQEIHSFKDTFPTGAVHLMQCYENHIDAEPNDDVFLVLEDCGRYNLEDWLAGKVSRNLNLEHPVGYLKFVSTTFSRIMLALRFLTLESRTDANRQPIQWVHHDLTLRNVVLKENGMVKIIDFGTMTRVSEDASTRDIGFTLEHPEGDIGFNLEHPWSYDVYNAGLIFQSMMEAHLEDSIKDLCEKLRDKAFVELGLKGTASEDPSLPFAAFAKWTNPQLRKLLKTCKEALWDDPGALLEEYEIEVDRDGKKSTKILTLSTANEDYERDKLEYLQLRETHGLYLRLAKQAGLTLVVQQMLSDEPSERPKPQHVLSILDNFDRVLADPTSWKSKATFTCRICLSLLVWLSYLTTLAFAQL